MPTSLPTPATGAVTIDTAAAFEARTIDDAPRAPRGEEERHAKRASEASAAVAESSPPANDEPEHAPALASLQYGSSDSATTQHAIDEKHAMHQGVLLVVDSLPAAPSVDPRDFASWYAVTHSPVHVP